MKICNRCLVYRPLSGFYPHKRMPDGFMHQCKKCVCKERREYRIKNTQKIKDRIALWHANNPTYTYQQYIKNQAKRRQQLKDWRKKHPDNVKRHNQKYFNKHPDIIKAVSMRRRARELNVQEKITAGDIKLIFRLFNNCCFHCGSTKCLTIDHFRPLSKGHALTLSNAILLCRSCNSSKGTKDPEQFFTKLQLKQIGKIISKAAKLNQKAA